MLLFIILRHLLNNTLHVEKNMSVWKLYPIDWIVHEKKTAMIYRLEINSYLSSTKILYNMILAIYIRSEFIDSQILAKNARANS